MPTATCHCPQCAASPRPRMPWRRLREPFFAASAGGDLTWLSRTRFDSGSAGAPVPHECFQRPGLAYDGSQGQARPLQAPWCRDWVSQLSVARHGKRAHPHRPLGLLPSRQVTGILGAVKHPNGLFVLGCHSHSLPPTAHQVSPPHAAAPLCPIKSPGTPNRNRSEASSARKPTSTAATPQAQCISDPERNGHLRT